ncbi:hypothetical protein WJ968_09510 [Achromobacter xylosoxidans]
MRKGMAGLCAGRDLEQGRLYRRAYLKPGDGLIDEPTLGSGAVLTIHNEQELANWLAALPVDIENHLAPWLARYQSLEQAWYEYRIPSWRLAAYRHQAGCGSDELNLPRITISATPTPLVAGPPRAHERRLVPASTYCGAPCAIAAYSRASLTSCHSGASISSVSPSSSVSITMAWSPSSACARRRIWHGPATAAADARAERIFHRKSFWP